MMRTFLNILVLSLFIVSVSCSEDGIDEFRFGTLKGTVVKAGDNTPLANVKITTNPSSNTVFTDEEGNFTIENIAQGEYSVQADLDEYVPAFEAASVIENNTVTVVFELENESANNLPPTAPQLIAPADNELLQSIEANFVWSASDPDEDALTYTLELRNDQNDTVELFENLTDTTYTFSPLMLGAKYFWQVAADDEVNDPVLSGVRSFEVVDSPTDNRFLFVRNINGNNVIFSANEEGEEFQLTSENSNSFKPKRNIAANKIAYFQSTGAQIDLYIMNLDGSNKTQVTSSVKPNGFNFNELNYSWPDNSEYIYFPSFDKLYRIRSNGQGLGAPLYQTTDGSFISEVDVSEDASVIALKTNNINGYDIAIFTIDFGGNILNTVLSGVEGAASGLNLSVTNQKLLYSYDVSGHEVSEYRRLDSRMFIYDFGTATATEISEEKPAGTNDLDPRFSPNEAQVIYTNTSNDGTSQRNVYREDISEVDTRELLFSDAFMPDWE